jgi:hypothetical protein
MALKRCAAYLVVSLCLLTGICIPSYAISYQLYYDYGYPPWCHNEGYPVWWHKRSNDNSSVGFNLGFPVSEEIKLLPSLTNQQRQQLTLVCEFRDKQVDQITHQLRTLMAQLKTKGTKLPAPRYMMPANTKNLTYEQRQYLLLSSKLHEQLYQLRYNEWLDAKRVLTEQQFEELKDTARKSGPQNIAPRKIVN